MRRNNRNLPKVVWSRERKANRASMRKVDKMEDTLIKRGTRGLGDTLGETIIKEHCSKWFVFD